MISYYFKIFIAIYIYIYPSFGNINVDTSQLIGCAGEGDFLDLEGFPSSLFAMDKHLKTLDLNYVTKAFAFLH